MNSDPSDTHSPAKKIRSSSSFVPESISPSIISNGLELLSTGPTPPLPLPLLLPPQSIETTLEAVALPLEKIDDSPLVVVVGNEAQILV